MSNIVKFIRENLAVLTVGIVLLGYYSVYSFYSLFGINIYNYMDASEILFAFSSLFKSMLTLLAFTFFGAWIAQHSRLLSFDDYIKEFPSNKEERKEHLYNTIKRKGRLTFILIPFLIGINVIIIKREWPDKIDESTLVASWICLYMIYFITFKFIFIFKEANSLNLDAKILEVSDGIKAQRKVNRILHIGFIIISFLILLYFRNIIKYENIVNGNPKYSINFEYKSKQIGSKKSIIYIGSTRNYIFMYDAEREIVNIYPEREVMFTSVKQLTNGL